MSSREFVIIDSSLGLSSGDDSPIEYEMYLSYNKFLLFFNKHPSSKCAKVIMSPVFSCDDVACGLYETVGCIKSASEYGRDMYSNAI